MTTPRDGLPMHLSEPVRLMLEEVGQRRPEPTLVLRHETCGCWLANVYRLNAGRLLLGETRTLVQRTERAAQARHQTMPVDLDGLDVDSVGGLLACSHGRVTINRAQVLEWLSTAKRRREVHTLS